MLKKILYWLFIFFVKVMQIFPKKIRRAYLFAFSRVVYFFARKTNRIIKANLDFVFDNKLSKEEIKKIQKYSYFNMNLWILSLIENLTVSDEELKKNVTIENVEVLEKLKKEKKPIILISAHYGNMEMLSCYLNKFVTPIHQVARQSNYEEFDKFIVYSREMSGANIVFRDGAVKKLVKALMKKEVISLIIDQNINSKDGIEVEFLGKKANQTATSATLARKFGAYVVPVAIFNQDNYKYNIKIYDAIEPIKTDNEKNDIKAMSQLHANAISAIISADPKQWFWPHKRFKAHNKEIYEKNFNNK